MTDRAEIERLLNATGRTLEGLPEYYPEEQQEVLYREVIENFELWENRVLHQSDVIELLVGALKDALDERDAALAKVPKWISVKDRLPEEKECVFVHYVDGWMTKAFMLGGKWYTISGETSWLSVTHWMPLPEPPEEEG